MPEPWNILIVDFTRTKNFNLNSNFRSRVKAIMRNVSVGAVELIGSKLQFSGRIFWILLIIVESLIWLRIF